MKMYLRLYLFIPLSVGLLQPVSANQAALTSLKSRYRLTKLNAEKARDHKITACNKSWSTSQQKAQLEKQCQSAQESLAQTDALAQQARQDYKNQLNGQTTKKTPSIKAASLTNYRFKELEPVIPYHTTTTPIIQTSRIPAWSKSYVRQRGGIIIQDGRSTRESTKVVSPRRTHTPGSKASTSQPLRRQGRGRGRLTQQRGETTSCLPEALKAKVRQVSAHFGKPALIVEGHRKKPKKGRKRKGAKNSLHYTCKAIDFTIPGVPLAKVQKYVLETFYHNSGIGFYCGGGRKKHRHIHIDNGSPRAWKGHHDSASCHPDKVARKYGLTRRRVAKNRRRKKIRPIRTSKLQTQRTNR